MPYQRLRSGTSLRSTAQAIAVPIAKATTADPPAYASEFARSSNDAWSVSTRANHLVVNWKSKTLPPDENAPSTRMASGKSVRYARTAIAAATITTSARHVGAWSATRRAVTPAEVTSGRYLIPSVARQKSESLSKSARRSRDT